MSSRPAFELAAISLVAIPVVLNVVGIIAGSERLRIAAAVLSIPLLLVITVGFAAHFYWRVMDSRDANKRLNRVRLALDCLDGDDDTRITCTRHDGTSFTVERAGQAYLITESCKTCEMSRQETEELMRSAEESAITRIGPNSSG